MKRNSKGSILKYFSTVKKSNEDENNSNNSITFHDDSQNTVMVPVQTEQSITIEEESGESSSSLCSVLPGDIKFYKNISEMNDVDKITAINNVENPESTFNYPQTILHGKSRKFQWNWLQTYPWLAYSKSTDCAYCKFCYFFGQNQEINLANVGFRNWHKSIETFKHHQSTEQHQKAFQIVASRESIANGKQQAINIIINKELEVQKLNNRALLGPIIEAIIICGRQNIGLRGKHDSGALFSTDDRVNDGNLRALLRWRAQSDSIFKDLIEKAPKNATYLSPTIQNEIISIIEKIIISRRVQKLKKSKFFSIYADETSDRANLEQLAIGVRYFDDEALSVKEDFLKFIQIKDQTAQTISTAIIDAFQQMNVDLNYCIGQGYDGAAVMSGSKSGVAKRISEKFPTAIYVHCMSHCLNLALTDSCDIPLLKSCSETIKSIFNFLNCPKRQTALSESVQEKCTESTKKKLKNICPTRFVERHQTTATFIELFDGVVHCLQKIADWKDDSYIAIGFLNSVLTFQFIMSLLSLDFALSITFGLSRYLQAVSIDLNEATEAASNVLDRFQEIRENLSSEFEKNFLSAKEIADRHEVDIKKPRFCGRPRLDGSNLSAKEYFENILFKPIIEGFITEIHERFQKHRNILDSFALIIKHNECTEDDFSNGIDSFLSFYGDFLPVPKSQFNAEIKMWRLKVSKLESKPTSIIEYIKICNKLIFPNVYKLFSILVTLPITNCTLERSFSKLNLIKSFDRTTMVEDRLNGLTLLSIYRDESINVQEILLEMSKSARKIKFNV